jgi:hypothetical protein
VGPRCAIAADGPKWTSSTHQQNAPWKWIVWQQNLSFEKSMCGIF